MCSFFRSNEQTIFYLCYESEHFHESCAALLLRENGKKSTIASFNAPFIPSNVSFPFTLQYYPNLLLKRTKMLSED